MLSKSWNAVVTDGYQGEVSKTHHVTSIYHGFGKNRQLLTVLLTLCVDGSPILSRKKILTPDL